MCWRPHTFKYFPYGLRIPWLDRVYNWHLWDNCFWKKSDCWWKFGHMRIILMSNMEAFIDTCKIYWMWRKDETTASNRGLHSVVKIILYVFNKIIANQPELFYQPIWWFYHIIQENYAQDDNEYIFLGLGWHQSHQYNFGLMLCIANIYNVKLPFLKRWNNVKFLVALFRCCKNVM